MLKKLYLFLVAASISSAALNANETSAASAEEPEGPTAEVEGSELSAENTDAAAESEETVEVSESELVEMVGLMVAQNGGVVMFELDDAGINAMASGLVEGLTGAKKIEDFSDEMLREVIGNIELRLKALEAESEDVPEVDEEDLKTIGFIILMQLGLPQLGFGHEDALLIKEGFIKGANMTEPDPSVEAKLPAFQEFMQKRVMAAQAKIAVEINAAKQAFFEQLAADPAIQKSESGLYYKILEPGAAEKPTLEDVALVHYKGTLIDGTKFDSSYDRGNPAEFPLSGVVKGFGEGLTKIGAGGKIILYIPSELGYGDNPRPGGPIKPGDTLIFECELIEVNPE